MRRQPCRLWGLFAVLLGVRLGPAVTLGGVPPGFLVYSNQRNPATLFSAPGEGNFLADDLFLTQPFGCNLAHYDLLVIGCNQVGPSQCADEAFDVHVELWSDNPCEAGAPIPGTEATWMSIPADNQPHTLEHTLSSPIGVPGGVWMRVNFSTDAGGWVVAERAEIGETQNLFALDRPAVNDCRLRFFGPGPPLPYGGFWANIRCASEPQPTGACCTEQDCTVETEADCAGIWRGADTSCAQNPCGTQFVVYDNRFITGIFHPLAGSRVADDLIMSAGSTPCDLAQYELAVAGRSGPLAFSVLLELWSNDVGADGISSADDLPLEPIAGTAAQFSAIRADNETHRLTAGPFPGGITLPEKIWLVAATSTNDSGPITAGLGDRPPDYVGTSADAYAEEVGGQWTGGHKFGGFNPTGCPGGPNCKPAGSFRINVICHGEQAAGACCDTETKECLDGIRLRQCQGRSQPGLCCSEVAFDPPCGAGDCPLGDMAFVDPPDGVIDARQPHDPETKSPAQGIRTLTALAPSGAAASCFTLCDTRGGCTNNRIAEVVEGPQGSYILTLDRPLTSRAVTVVRYLGSETAGSLTTHSGNVNGDGVVSVLDVLSLLTCLTSDDSPSACPWGFPYSRDLDQSGMAGPLDLLRSIDLLNGSDTFDPAINTPLPSGTCP